MRTRIAPVILSMDHALMPYFKSLRATTGKNNPNSCFAPNKGKDQIFRALPVDMNSWATNNTIEDHIRNAAEKHDCVFLYAHEINNPLYKYNISRDRLIFIAQMAKKYNLDFVTTSEMTN
ncbi:MAG: hypothetical protein K2X48_14690 [Chitinophagaceae bacterium]|nr:hypothetical protein [Chitinophagaceae bacterium]